MRTLVLLILVTAFFLNCALVTHLVHSQSSETLTLFFIQQGIISLFVAASIYLTSSQREKSRSLFALFFFTSFFMPVFGILIVMLIYIFWQFIRTPIDLLQYQPIEAHEINIDEHQLHSHYGSGGAIQRIFNEKLPDRVRTDALLAVSYAENKHSNKILLESIKSSSNQVRLLAYSIINSQENALTKQITELNKSLQHTHSIKKRGILLKYLGEAYWELSYKGLIEGKQRDTMLENSLRYLEQAKDILKTDGEIYYYIARLYLSKKQYDIAKSLLTKAMEFHISPDVIIPYLAEIYYDEGNYFAIRRLMNLHKEFEYIPTLAQVMKMWRTQ